MKQPQIVLVSRYFDVRSWLALPKFERDSTKSKTNHAIDF